MAVNDANDSQIRDLLENGYPLKAIKVDFRDLNNKNLIIASSFKEAYLHLDDPDKKDSWFFIVGLDIIRNCINVIGLVSMTTTIDRWLELRWLEVSSVYRKTGQSHNIFSYLKRFAEYRHLSGIRAYSDKTHVGFFRKFNFRKKENSTVLEWES